MLSKLNRQYTLFLNGPWSKAWFDDAEATDGAATEHITAMHGNLGSKANKLFKEVTCAQRRAMREARQATKADGRVCTFKPSDLYLPKAPFEWWNSFGTELPELAEFAKRAMAAKASNSATERNWSRYGHVHSAKRSMITTEGEESKAEKSAHLFANGNISGNDEY